MMPRLEYKSFGFLPFNSIRILVFGFLILWAFLSLSFEKPLNAALWSALPPLLIVAIQVAASYVVVRRKNYTIEIQSHNEFIMLENVHTVKSWWCYEFGFATRELGTGMADKANTHANKINCFLEFISDKGSIWIYEQIHLGEKFPNNHPYLAMEYIDEMKIFRVWDIDKCLEQLQFSELKEAPKGLRKLTAQH